MSSLSLSPIAEAQQEAEAEETKQQMMMVLTPKKTEEENVGAEKVSRAKEAVFEARYQELKAMMADNNAGREAVEAEKEVLRAERKAFIKKKNGLDKYYNKIRTGINLQNKQLELERALIAQSKARLKQVGMQQARKQQAARAQMDLQILEHRESMALMKRNFEEEMKRKRQSMVKEQREMQQKIKIAIHKAADKLFK